MGSAVSSTAHAKLDTAGGRGHSYSETTVTGNARAHNGDVYNIRKFYGTWPDALSRQRQQGATFSSVRALISRKRSVDDFEDKPCQGENPFLTMAISQLGEFSTSLQHQKQDEAARKVVSWIRVVVDATEANGTAAQGTHTKEELAKMQSGLLLTNRVGINTTDRRKIPDQVIKITRKSSLIILGRWKVALETTHWEAVDEHNREVRESFTALRLTPLDLASASPIAAFFGERTDYLQSSVIHPNILAYRRVSRSSKVFDVILNDDPKGLVLLLAEQKATIRDLDEQGRSLLHYACHYNSPDCCAFLIEAGAEIDGIADLFYRRYGTGTPLLVVLSYARDMPSTQCASLLLDAGADPNVHDRDNPKSRTHVSPLYTALMSLLCPPLTANNTTEYIMTRTIREAHIVPTESVPDDVNPGIWLYAFKHPMLPSPAILKELLAVGCDINDTAMGLSNTPDGWSCLFLQVLHAWHPETSREFETLRFLLRQNVNVFATDAFGLTIFDRVNAPRSIKLPSYQRDLWYCALKCEGVDIGLIGKRHPRIAHYVIWITGPRRMFLIKSTTRSSIFPGQKKRS